MLSGHMRPLISRLVAVATAIFIVIVVGFGVLSYVTFSDMCGNKILSQSVSPDGTKKLVVFQRDCGATTGFSTQASLLAGDETLLNHGGNVFAADTDHGSAASDAGGGPELRSRWETPNQLLLEHHVKARVFKAERSFKGSDIRYETLK